MPDATSAIEARPETGLPRRGRRRSNAEDVNSTMTAATALFRRLDAAGTGYVPEDQVQWLWPTLTQHLEGAPQNFTAQRQQGGAEVSFSEWQSLMSAVCSVVGSRRLKSSLRRADVIVSKGQMVTARAFTPLQSSVTLPLYANYCDLKPASVAPTAPSSPGRRSAGPSSPGLRPKPESPKEPVSPGRATRERPHTDRVITVDPRPARPTSNTKEAGKTTTEQPSNEVVTVDPSSPTGPQSPAAGKTTTEQPSVEEVAADPGSPTGPQSPAAGKTTTEQPSVEEVAVDPGSPTGPQSPAAGKTTREEASVEEVAVDPGPPTGPQSPAAGKTTTEQPSVEEVVDPGSPTGPQSPAAGKTTTEQPSAEEVVDPGSPTGPQSPAAGKTTTEQPSVEEVAADPGSPTGPQSPAAGKTTTEQPSVEEVAVDPVSPTGPQSPAAGKTTTEQSPTEPHSPTQPQSPTAGKTTREEASVEEVAADPGSPTGPQSPAAGKTTTEQPSVEEVPGDPGSPSGPQSPAARKTTTEQPSVEEVAVDPGSPTGPPSPAAGKATTEQPSVEEVAADPGSSTGPQSPQAAGKSTTQQPSIEEVPADPGSPTGPQSPAAGKTTTEQPSVEEVAADPGSPTGPQSPAAGKTTTEQPSVEEVAADPGSPTGPQSPAAGKTATEQPSVEEAAVDPGSPTGPQSPETEQQPSNEGQEGMYLPVAVISPAVERADVPAAAPSSSILAVLGPAEAAEAEAFQRRFHQLRQGSNLPKMAKKKSGKVYHTGITDAIEPEPQDGGRTHEVMGVNTHVMTVAERPHSAGTPTDPRERRPSWAHDGPELHFDDQVAIHEPELPTISVHDTDAPAEVLMGKREREEDGPAESRKAPQSSVVHLPPISRAATAPGSLCDENEDLQSILDSSNVKALKDRLRSEMTLHEQTRNHAKELEKRLQLATKPRSSQKPRFGITSTAPYDRRPQRRERSERSVVLPPLKPLKSAQSSRSPKRSADGALRNVHEMLKDENMSILSRGGQSRTRLQAYGRLTRAGLSTWDVRLDEKISRFQDMRAFSDSMWNSFHDWNTQYHSVG